MPMERLIFVMLFGVSVMFFAIGVMTEFIIEIQLGEFFGRRRMRRMIHVLRDHYILCGFGRVGRGAAQELRRSGVPFVVVDSKSGRAERAAKRDMLVQVSDATSDESLSADTVVDGGDYLVVMGDLDHMGRLQEMSGAST